LKNRLVQTTLLAMPESPPSDGLQFRSSKICGVRTISQKASDFVMLDVMKIGGIAGWGRAIGQTEAADLPVSSHLFPEISAQLLAVSPQAHWLEYQDWAASILQRSLEVKDGFAISHNEPGFGIAWAENAVQRYRLR
jgi:mandelate racemase